MDVTLFVTEWLARMVDILLDVSEEMVDNGRGMNSRTSDILTRDRSCPLSSTTSSCVPVVEGSCLVAESMG